MYFTPVILTSVKMVCCVICEEREKGEGLRRKGGEAGLGGLLSASPGQQPNIHAVLA